HIRTPGEQRRTGPVGSPRAGVSSERSSSLHLDHGYERGVRFRLGILNLLLAVSLLAGCGAPGKSPPPVSTASSRATPGAAYTPSPLTPPVKITIGLPASTSDSGIFIANDRGYFRQEGIDLEIQRFQTLVDMVAPLTTGQLPI